MDFDIKHIARLAQLRISEEEIPALEREFRSIIEMLGELPEPEEHETHHERPAMKLRSDRAVPCLSTQEELLSNAPELNSGCIAVPKTVE